MSDPLSIAGSIAGIVQLSASVFQQVSKFIKDAKGAEKTVKDLADQTRNLSGVLQNLSLLASSLEQETSFSAFKAHHLHACRQTLLAVEKRLEKPLSGFNEGSGREAVYRSLRWPFSADDTKGLLAQIEGHRSTISLALSTDTLESMLKCLEKQDSIIGRISSLNQKVERLTAIQTRIECDEKRQKIVDYFMKVNPQVNLQTSSRLRQPLTGLWLTESTPTFLRWADLPRSGLWLSGIPGTGKTILSGMVIEKTLQKSSQSVAVAFFYCDYKNIDSQKLLNVLSTIAVQLSQQNHEAFDILKEYHAGLKSASGLNAEPEPKDLLNLILTIISVYEKVFIVLDGLDECGDNVAEVAEAIKFLFEASPSASIAVFSRDEPEIRDEFAAEFAHIEIAAHTDDLDIYIRAEMVHRRQLRNLSIQNPLFAEEIRHQLVNGAQGMFRWASCQLDYLCDLSTNRARREALKSLPPTLPETYHKILFRVSQSGTDSMNLVRRVLHWTIAGSRMTLAEMREAVSFTSCPDNEFGPDDLIDVDEIFRRCSSLVRVSETTMGYSVPSIELAHFTVKEYLTSIDDNSDVNFFKYKRHEADTELSKACLRLFVSRAKDTKLDPMADITLNMNTILERFVGNYFYLYSTARLCGVLSSNANAKSHGEFWSHMQSSADLNKFKSLFQSAQGISLLELAIGSRVRRMIADSSLLKGHWDKGQIDHRAIFAKAEAKRLLAALLSPDFTPLQLAAAMGNPILCMSLCERTTSISSWELQLCLYFAFSSMNLFYRRPECSGSAGQLLGGCFMVGFRTLLRNKAIETLLRAFVRESTDKTLCFARDTTRSAADFSGNTLLHTAALYGELKLVNILLEAGFLPDNRNSNSMTPFDLAVQKKSWEVADRFLEFKSSEFQSFKAREDAPHGNKIIPDFVTKGLEFMPPQSATVVRLAVLHDDWELLKAVIDQGVSVDVELPDCLGCSQSPLVLAIILGKRQVLLWLLSHGASLQNSACRKLPMGLQSVISLIVFYRLDMDILDLALKESLGQKIWCMEEELSPLHVAALRSNSDAMKLLIEHLEAISLLFGSMTQHYKGGLAPATPMLKVPSTMINFLSTGSAGDEDHWPEEDKFRGGPLHYAVISDCEASVLLLLSHGADPNVIDERQRSPLIIAAQYNLAPIAQLLVKSGADLAISDCMNMTALMCAAAEGNMGMIQILDKSNLVLSMPDHRGYTALHHAVSGQDTAARTFNYFIERGLDPACSNFNPTRRAAIYVFHEGMDNKTLIAYILNSGFLARIEGLDVHNPLSCAVRHSNHDLLHRLWRIFEKHTQTLEYLNTETEYNYSPLCLAAMDADKDTCIRKLLDYRADPNKEGRQQGSPLMAACTFGRLEAVKILIRSGVAVAYTNEKGTYRNAFTVAAPHPHIQAWLLVGRFQDQQRLCADSFWKCCDAEVGYRSGVLKVEWKLVGKNKRLRGESMLDYLNKRHRLKRWANGRVLVR